MATPPLLATLILCVTTYVRPALLRRAHRRAAPSHASVLPSSSPHGKKDVGALLGSPEAASSWLERSVPPLLYLLFFR